MESAYLKYVRKYGHHWSTIYDAIQHDLTFQQEPGPWTLLRGLSKVGVIIIVIINAKTQSCSCPLSGACVGVNWFTHLKPTVFL